MLCLRFNSVVDWFQEIASNNANSPAIDYVGGKLNYSELRLHVAAITRQLNGAVQEPGRVVGLLIDHLVNRIISLLSAMGVGGVATPSRISPLAATGELMPEALLDWLESAGGQPGAHGAGLVPLCGNFASPWD